ncbi:hypothetical protein ACO2Q3_16365 [Caulobacter sp. KR2-114]|uniref:hypothetical protein n=1 Tax=Caulobacter sp. KR2-114 TaxID=3400912 RepID=UPI003C03DF45
MSRLAAARTPRAAPPSLATAPAPHEDAACAAVAAAVGRLGEPSAEGPGALFLGDPVRAAVALAKTGVSRREAVWALSESMATALTDALRDGRQVFAERALRRDPAGVLTAMAQAVGSPAPARPLASLAQDLAGALPAAAVADDPWLAALELLAGPLAPGTEADWPLALFMAGDSPGASCPAAIDVTGRGRILAYGPYLRLPAGRWRAGVVVEVCPDAARRPYRLEVSAGATIARAVVAPGRPGPRTLAADVELHDAAPVELRLWLERAAFHGTLRFAGARITFLGPAPHRLEAP